MSDGVVIVLLTLGLLVVMLTTVAAMRATEGRIGRARVAADMQARIDLLTELQAEHHARGDNRFR